MSPRTSHTSPGARRATSLSLTEVRGHILLDLAERHEVETVEDIYAIPVLRAAWSRHSIDMALAAAIAGTAQGCLTVDGLTACRSTARTRR